MPHEVIYFDPLPLEELPEEAIFRRLKYHPHLTHLTPKGRADLRYKIESARALLALKGAVRRVKIRMLELGKIELETGETIRSVNLREFLDHCEEALLMAATAGHRITEEIGRLMERGEMAKASILDAAASETTDAALDWLMKYENQLLRREGRALMPTRFSPGYGDLGLENQHTFYQLLELKRLGLELSPRYVLIPEKSVTAITGIISSHGKVD